MSLVVICGCATRHPHAARVPVDTLAAKLQLEQVLPGESARRLRAIGFTCLRRNDRPLQEFGCHRYRGEGTDTEVQMVNIFRAAAGDVARVETESLNVLRETRRRHSLLRRD